MALTPERWKRARDVLHEARQMDEKERTAFLDRQCNGDSKLRDEVEKLLEAEGELGSSFLESPTLAHAAVRISSSSIIPSYCRKVPSLVPILSKRLFRKALGDRSHLQPRVINTDL